MATKLIIVHGPPASGKTTLATSISRDLGLPVVSKDNIKEFLLDEFGARDREWSYTLGSIAIQSLYLIAEELLRKGETIIIDCAFYTDAVEGKLTRLAKRTNASCLEVYCTAAPETRYQRFVARNESGERNKNHNDSANYGLNDAAAQETKYAPLNIAGASQLIVDTTDFQEADYQKLLADIAVFVQETTAAS